MKRMHIFYLTIHTVLPYVKNIVTLLKHLQELSFFIVSGGPVDNSDKSTTSSTTFKKIFIWPGELNNSSFYNKTECRINISKLYFHSNCIYTQRLHEILQLLGDSNFVEQMQKRYKNF